MSKDNLSNTSLVTIKVLGCRGSMPISGLCYVKYGCATSSYLYMTDTEAIIIDAGTGILNIPDLGDRHISILISHSHIDHILGLPTFLPTLGTKEITIYGATHEGLTIRQQLDTYLRHPLWPVGLDIFPCKKNYVEVKEDGSLFKIGDVTVTAVPSNHPGGSTIFKLEYAGTSVVYASDFEHEELPEDRKDKGLIEAEELLSKSLAGASSAETADSCYAFATNPLAALASFSKGADLVLYDAQYTSEEYSKSKSFGHSTAEKACELKNKAGIKQILLVHHAPSHTDEFLDNMGNSIHQTLNCSVNEMHLAKEGEVIEL